MTTLATWITWFGDSWPLLLLIGVPLGLLTVWLDRHPEAAEAAADRIYR